MPQYKDESTGKWYSKFYYDDWTGQRKQKFKRGFQTKREAAAWERNFLEKQQENPDMLFQNLVTLYLEDMGHRLKETTMYGKEKMITTKLLPYFTDKPINTIKPTDIRKWQNTLKDFQDEKGNSYSETYLKTINNQFSAIMNYAVRFYGLKSNPCHKAGSMGKKNADEMQFWTLEEFNQFLPHISNRIYSRIAFLILYWTGIRKGELIALTIRDIDLEGKIIRIDKTMSRVNGKQLVTPPKTPKSNRTIAIPDFLCEELNTYINGIYKATPDDRLFHFTQSHLSHEMIRGTAASGIKKIRVHDLRHSHASLLIELGFSPIAIAERLGHEHIETTLSTYSHLYPHKQTEIVSALQKANSIKLVSLQN